MTPAVVHYLPASHSVRASGRWTLETAGGCPKYTSWTRNPQFELFPSVASATYTIAVSHWGEAPVGVWVMGPDPSGRRRRTVLDGDSQFSSSKFAARAQQYHTVVLEQRPAGRPYLVVASTFEPGQLGEFIISVSSPDDPGLRLVQIDGSDEVEEDDWQLEGEGPYRAPAPTTAPPATIASCDTLVLCGPVIGTVTSTSALILLEIDETATISCVAVERPARPDGHTVRCTKLLPKEMPTTFHLEGLVPGSAYDVTFEGLAPLQQQMLRARGCVVRTRHGTELTSRCPVDKLRFIAVSCDRPSMMQKGEVNPWDAIADKCARGECDVMLHLGDQIYAKDNGWQAAALRVQSLGEEPGAPPSLVTKMAARAMGILQEAYKSTWALPKVAQALSHASHLMIWSDNDVANDFSCMRSKDGTQAYTPAYLRVAMTTYQWYQRALWDASYVPAPVATRIPSSSRETMEEGHFHVIGGCGVLMIDSRGNRIGPDGALRRDANGGDDGGLPPLMSQRQRDAVLEAFATPGLQCLLVCSEIPFIGSDPETIRKAQKKVFFLVDHWPWCLTELLWLLDLCFEFKAGAPGREVVLLGGDIHAGAVTTVRDATTNLSITQVTTSPVTNHVSAFIPAPTGELSSRYSYTHEPIPPQRNYCTIDLSFSPTKGVTADIELVGVPVSEENMPH